VSKVGTGRGTVRSTPAGIDCGTVCHVDFANGTVVTLTAAPDGGSTFVSWTGEGCSGAGACRVTMDAPRQVTAIFDLAAGRRPGYDSAPAPGSGIDVGTARVGGTVTAALMITETGDMTLLVTPTLSGADDADFWFEPATLAVRDGGGGQALTIGCTPSVSGTLAATLTVVHNAPGSPAVYALGCRGEGYVYTVYLPTVVRSSWAGR
jgi:hypothetical protein